MKLILLSKRNFSTSLHNNNIKYHDIRLILNNLIYNSIISLYGLNVIQKQQINVMISKNMNLIYGHYQCTNAMLLSHKLKINSYDIAKDIINNIEKNDIIENITIDGPGFMNIWYLFYLFITYNIFIIVI